MAPQPKTLDLFSGCGGLSLGFKQAGFEVKVANDIWKVALNTFSLNFPESTVILGDINKPEIQAQIIEACGDDVDVIIGGPPCQAYSLAGSRDPNDPRGKLFTSYVDIVEALRPKAFVVENVKGILSMKHFKNDTPPDIIEKYKEVIQDRKSRGLKVSMEELNNQIDECLVHVPELIKSTFEDVGYKVDYKLLNSADYGVPQERQRVFFIGINQEKTITFPHLTHSKHNTLLSKWTTLREAIGDLPFPEIAEGDEVYEGTYSPIYMSRNRRRMWNEVSYTIQAGARHAPLHPASPPMTKLGTDEWKFGEGPQRRLSVRECARVQTFPDTFEFTGSVSNKYKQIGNAVPSLLAQRVAKSVLKLIRG